MPIKQSAIKERRKAIKQTVINTARKRRIKETLKKFQKAVTAANIAEAQKIAEQAVQLLDKAAKQHVMHKNKVARTKSRMYAKLRK